MRHTFLWIGKREQASGQVWPGIAGKIKYDRLRAAFDPDFATHNSFYAIVNLTPHDTVMNPKSHSRMMGNLLPYDNISVVNPISIYGLLFVLTKQRKFVHFYTKPAGLVSMRYRYRLPP